MSVYLKAAMDKLKSLTHEYCQQEIQLAQVADSLGVTRKDLIENPYDFSIEVREKVVDILYKQINLITEGREIKKRNITSESVVDLTFYRQLLQRDGSK